MGRRQTGASVFLVQRRHWYRPAKMLLGIVDSGSPSVVVQRRRAVEDALTEQVQLRSAVHLPLEHLESIDLSFGLPLAPGQGECRVDRCSVTFQVLGESLQALNPALPRLVQALTDCRAIVLPDEPPKLLTERVDEVDIRTTASQLLQCTAVVRVELLGQLHAEPARLAWRQRIPPAPTTGRRLGSPDSTVAFHRRSGPWISPLAQLLPQPLPSVTAGRPALTQMGIVWREPAVAAGSGPRARRQGYCCPAASGVG